MGFVFPFFFLSHKMLNAKRKELIITAVNVIILSEVKIALLRFQFLPRFSLLFYFFILVHSTGQNLLPRGKGHNRTSRSLTRCPTSPTPHLHTKDSHSIGITLLLYE